MDNFFLLKFAGESSRPARVRKLQNDAKKNNRPSRHAGRSGFEFLW
jgi:hypothetical protein